jgi:eukaryotic-like serine/threonine-protein kinase
LVEATEDIPFEVHGELEPERSLLTQKVFGGPLIGRGGMGQVHHAYDPNLRRFVVLKLIQQEKASDEANHRFLLEAQITAQLDHPNIPAVHELGYDFNHNFCVSMKRVRGRTLKQILMDREYSPDKVERLFEVLNIFVRVCDAMAFAHSKGVIHLDLKPENVMVGIHGQVYVMDWGIARVLRGSPVRLEREQVALPPGGSSPGTANYMAPEQARGHHSELSPATDVFQLGALLYYILTRRPPYVLEEGVPLLRAYECKPKHPQDVTDVELPSRLCEIAMHAMAESPNDRYESATALKEAVQTILRGGGFLPSRRVVAGEVVIREGDPPDNAYVIESGTFRVWKYMDGDRRILAMLTAGDVFGEAAICSGELRSATVEAVEDGVLLVITMKNFEREMDASLLGNFVRALAGRFRDIDRRAAAHARRLLDATLFSHILTYLNFRGHDVDGRRVASWSPLLDYLSKVDPRSREELFQVVSRMSGMAIDQTSDRIALSKPLGFQF